MKVMHIRIVSLFAFIFISIGIIWKCRFGYAYLDEAFYPSIAYRVLQGDRLFWDEWNNTQLSNLALIPLLKFYIMIKGDTSGIYLFIRYTYTAIKIVLSLCVYVRLKKFSEFGAILSSLAFLIFSAYGLMVLSYNSIAIGSMLCTLLLMLNKKDGVKEKVFLFFAGITLSLSVLSQPYFSLIYVIYAVTVLFLYFRKRESSDHIIDTFYSINALGWVTVGVALCVLIFLIYIFHFISIEQLAMILPYILRGDPAHPQKSLYELFPGYLARILVGNHRNYYTFVIYLLIGAATLITYIMKRKQKAYLLRAKLILINIMLTIILLTTYLITEGHNSVINAVIFVPNVLGFILVMVSDDKVITEIFKCVWIPGMILTYLEYLASNTGFEGISAYSCIAATGSMLIIGRAISEYKNHLERIGVILLKAFSVLIIIGLIYVRLNYIFWDDGIEEQSMRIAYGPDEGLWVSETAYDYYEGVYKDTEFIRAMDKDTKVVYISDKSLYLAGNQRCASYSPLCYSIADTDLLNQYYKLQPEKKADVVYIDKIYGYATAERFADQLDLELREGEKGWILLKE